MKIALAPYTVKLGRRLHSVPLGDLHWGGGAPSEGTVGDLEPTDHLLAYAHRKLLWRPSPKVRARVSCLAAEPRAVEPELHRALRLLWWRFFRVFTHDPVLLRKLPNAVFLPFGGTLVPRDGTFVASKTRPMSLVASEKRSLEGHRLRHSIADWTRSEGLDVDLLGRGYRAIKEKEEGLVPYRFSVVIENQRRDNYFSEKLIDAFYCDTIPIYWGTPNIERYFDTRGIVVCRTEAELKQAVTSLGEDDYRRLAEYLPVNRKRAEQFIDYEDRAIDLLRREVEASR